MCFGCKNKQNFQNPQFFLPKCSKIPKFIIPEYAKIPIFVFSCSRRFQWTRKIIIRDFVLPLKSGHEKRTPERPFLY